MKPGIKWLEFAVDDIDSAEIMLRERKYNNVCYFSHQAVEKALKGFLEYNGLNPPRIHDLIELLKSCQKVNADFERYLVQVRILNQFYIPTRYPVAPAGSLPNRMPGEDLARRALEHAREIVEYCRSYLS